MDNLLLYSIIILSLIVIYYLLFKPKVSNFANLQPDFVASPAEKNIRKYPLVYSETDYRGPFAVLPPGEYSGDAVASIITSAQIKSIYIPPSIRVQIYYYDGSDATITASKRSIINSDVPITSVIITQFATSSLPV